MAESSDTRDRFFKYTSGSTAVKILESAAVRYSSPLLFNDPFDVQSGLHFDFDIETLPEKILTRIEALVAQDRRPDLPADDPWGKAIGMMWDKKATRGFPKDRIWEMFRPGLTWLKEQVVLFQAQYQQGWQNDFLPRLRVFSVSEEKDNLLMWAHYARDHTGVVFEFLVLTNEDNPLCVAQPVIYRRSPPPLFTEQQWLDDILGVRRLNLNELYYEYAHIKSDAWAYEKEWRVWYPAAKPQSTLHFDCPLWQNEVMAVYFGCRTPGEVKEKITSLIAEKFPATKLYQARKSADAYKLEFDTI
jgi:hypothetical protein